MVRLRCSTSIPAPVERVWALLRDFNGHDAWHPAVEHSQIEFDEPSDKVGAVRHFRLRNGAYIREQLLSLSDRQLSFRYFILEAPVSLRNYVAEVRLRPVTSDNACYCEWQVQFDPPVAERESLTRFVHDEIIGAGFEALRRAVYGEAGPRVDRAETPAFGSSSGREAIVIVVSRYGGPEVLEARTILVPEPKIGEARIRQTAVGVNFIDIYCRRGSFTLVPPGGVLGMEAAGVVESVGPGVAAVRAGDWVAYACAPPGAYATLRALRADMLVKLPPTLSDLNAAALMLKGVTASFLLHDVYAVKPGDHVLVHAAAGGVGQILCRWAKGLGAYVIGVTSSETKAAQARRVGCDTVLLSNSPDLVEEVQRLTQGLGVQVVYDAVGNDTFDTSIACLAPRGNLVSFGQASGDVGSRSIDQLASRSLTLSRPSYAHYTDTAEKFAVHTARLFAALASGLIVAEQPRIYPLTDGRRAHADLEGRGTTGALILVP